MVSEDLQNLIGQYSWHQMAVERNLFQATPAVSSSPGA